MRTTTPVAADEDELFDEPAPTPREKLAAIRDRVMQAQDAVGWSPQPDGEFHETMARSVVEYGRCLRELISLVQTLLPVEGAAADAPPALAGSAR